MPDSLPSQSSLSEESEIATLRELEQQILWLSAWTIHNANHLRESRDGLKVGGHQASCASMTTLMAALYFSVLRPTDRIAVKPHASPVLHAIEYLYGRQTLDQLKRFRGLGGAQSYPSRTKDKIRVDYSTGSVGLGVAITAFGSMVQDFLLARGWKDKNDTGRYISLLGDAELDEGNIYEALIEGYKHDLRNTWWIVDYNRQSLDATTPERMFDRFDDMFETAGWEVITLKYGRRQREAFKKPGGARLQKWIEDCPNDLYAALTYEGGAAWRDQLKADLSRAKRTIELIESYDDDALALLMTELGGHCMETLLEAFEKAGRDETPKFIIAYTTKGFRLPFQGHKDNHSGLMTPTQIEAFREKLGIPEDEEWTPFAGLEPDRRDACQRVLDVAPMSTSAKGPLKSNVPVTVPELSAFPDPGTKATSTQAAFGRILADLAREDSEFVQRIVTTSPDVTVSTNLGGFVNRKGIFSRHTYKDIFKDKRIASPQNWSTGPQGQHIELGIAENNLFLVLAALGLSGPIDGEPLFPIGTVYDPFIARGLDALNYACYQGAKFILAGTPSGVTLAPEGGAHQSIHSPLVGMGQPGLTYYEPAFADELRLILHRGFQQIADANGEATYLRLSTRVLDQPDRNNTVWNEDCLKGAYWRVPPSSDTDIVIVYTGAIAPEVMTAFETVREDVQGAGLLAVTSPDLLHRGWTRSGRAPWTGEGREQSHIEDLFADISPKARIVTVVDGSPSTLSWLGAVKGQRVIPLGIESFGQTGDLPDIYGTMRLDADAILDAVASAVSL